MVVKAVLGFPVHLAVNAYLHLDHRSVSVAIEMMYLYEKDHHHYPEAYRLSVMRVIRHGLVWWLR